MRKLNISQLNNQKALGPTSIQATIHKGNIEVLEKPLALILDQSFEQDVFSKILKIALIILIHKKRDTVTVSKYRFISLLSIFTKIFEKSMYRRIYFFFFGNRK